MAVRYFRLDIRGTDESKLQTIKNWFDTKIEVNDLDTTLGFGTSLGEEIGNQGIFLFTCDIYIKKSVAVSKYKNIIVNKFTSYDKTGLISAKVIQYDDCTHDEELHTPCEPTTRMEWNN